MKNLFLLFFIFFISFVIAEEIEPEVLPLTASEQVATTYYDEEILVGGLVSPLNGSLQLMQTDLIEKGAQSIYINRYYQAPYVLMEFDKNKEKNFHKRSRFLFENYRGWQYFPQIKIQAKRRGKDLEIRLVESNGAIFDFCISNKKTTLLSPSYGICNYSGGVITAKYDIRNTKIEYLEDQNLLIIYSPKGEVRYYRSHKKPFSAQTYCDYLLEREVLSNGKVLKYAYNNLKRLQSISSYDPNEKIKYASIKIEGYPCNGDVCFQGSSNKTKTRYFYGERKYQKGKYKEKGTKIKYKQILPPILASVSSAFYKDETQKNSEEFLLTEFNGKNITFKCEYEPVQGEKILQPHFRVKRLFLPVGENDAFIPVYTFTYAPPIPGKEGGNTQVKKSDGTSIIYYFSKELLLTGICYLDKNNKLIKTKNYQWNTNQWLLSEEIQDQDGRILILKRYEYDQFGNPIKEIFSGDLTGNGKNESYTVKRRFSQDGRHLLMEEENEDGKLIFFKFLSKTNLITSKITKDKNKDKILIREFYEYDENNNLIKEIIDDGDSKNKEEINQKTERKSIEYTLKQEEPFTHMALWKVEKYLDKDGEKLLKKTHYSYDEFGNVCQEDVYNAKEELIYCVKREYNERGDLLSETKPIDVSKKEPKILKVTYDYNEKGRLKKIINFSGRLQTNRSYDKRNRLKGVDELGSDGIFHTYHYEYDENDNLTKKIDPYRNIIKYNYDPFCSLPSEEEKPAIRSFSGNILAVKTYNSYDILENALSKTDANGNTTYFEYGAYGKPIKKTYPNGFIELFTYYKNGNLESHTDQNELTTKYTYDVLDRVISKTYEKNNQKIAEENFSYNVFHLLSRTDKEGHITRFTYDKAGRKIQEDFEGRIIDFSYDLLGRLQSTIKHNSSNTLVISYEKDLLDRIVQERKEDINGTLLHKISYEFDDDGNRMAIIRYIQGKKAITSFAYDALGRKTEEKDAEGYVTSTYYDDKYLVDGKIESLRTETIDPKNRKTCILFDSHGRKIKREIKNAKNELISCAEFFYDPHGNLTLQEDYIFEGVRHVRNLLTSFSYNQSNLLQSLTRAYGSADQRITFFDYTPIGKLSSKKRPSGTVLFYDYNPFGDLEKITSSGGKVLQTFEYNLLGRIKKAEDHIQKTFFKRTLDKYGNVLEEKFSNGLTIKKQYDDFDRPICITYPDESFLEYHYGSLYVRKISRFDPDSQPLYEHHFEEYDLDGNLTAENTINNFGLRKYTYDPIGRQASIHSPYFSQENSFDEVGCLVKTQGDNASYLYEYDDLSQLISEKGNDQCIHYGYDSNYNHRFNDNQEVVVNDLDEISQAGEIHCSYDLDGRLTDKVTLNNRYHFSYDPLDRLLEVESKEINVRFTYDALGRRLNKMVYYNTSSNQCQNYHENYLYDGNQEIGAYSCNEAKQIKITGIRHNKVDVCPVALEINNKIYLPVLDYQGNVRRLIDSSSKTIFADYAYTPYGEDRNIGFDLAQNPYRYFGKRYDKELDLYSFGHRYYDPTLKRWLTPDPEGFTDSMNLYQFLMNSPYLYTDPDGRAAWMIPLFSIGVASGPAGWLLLGAVAVATVWVGYETYQQHVGATENLSADIANASSYSLFEVMDKGTLVNVPPGTVEIKDKNKGKEKQSEKIKEAKEKIEEWLGDDTKVITNPDGDKIFISQDGKRKIRFDFEDPHGDEPHLHLEEKINGKWQDASNIHRIYPNK